MEINTSTTNIVLNIAIQILNMVLFFWVVIKFLAKPLSSSIDARIQKEKKLALADETYQKIISDAEVQAIALLKEANQHRENLIRQAELSGKQKSEELVAEAERKANLIVDTANKQANLTFVKLEGEFVAAVESTTRELVKKLFKDQKVEKDYIHGLIQELTQSVSSR